VCLALLACQQPVIGERVDRDAVSEGPAIVIEDASFDLHGHPVATFSVTMDGVPLLLDGVLALAPRFTFATLTSHPVDGLRAWKSQVLVGTIVPKVRPSGPGTPDPEVLTSVAQPGAETPSAFVDLGGGRYRYVFRTALSGFDPDETQRVGV